MRALFLPAAGNRNGTSLNNAGFNGNYWSSSLNTDNPNNAYNLNFNSGNVNMNNNNRNYGQSVRPVCLSQHSPMSGPLHLTREQLLSDLHDAYRDARRHKRSKPYQQRKPQLHPSVPHHEDGHPRLLHAHRQGKAP